MARATVTERVPSSFSVLVLSRTSRHRTSILAPLTHSRPQLRRLLAIIIPLIPRTNRTDFRRAAICNGSRVAVVAVHASEQFSVDGPDAVHGYCALVLRRFAITAGAVDLAEVLGVEVFDVYGSYGGGGLVGEPGGRMEGGELTAAVVLDDLVAGSEGAADDDVGCAGGLEDGQGI